MLRGNEVIRYIKFMPEYVELGYMIVVDDFLSNFENLIYLPHHEILKEL